MLFQTPLVPNLCAVKLLVMLFFEVKAVACYISVDVISQVYQAALRHPSSASTQEFLSLAQLTSLKNQTCLGPLSTEDDKLGMACVHIWLSYPPNQGGCI